MHLPSAGMIRFRFDGFASLHLSRLRHPEVATRIRGWVVDARGIAVSHDGTRRLSNKINMLDGQFKNLFIFAGRKTPTQRQIVQSRATMLKCAT
jgi:hypothetical protein